MATPVLAATTPNSVVTAQTPKLAVVQFLQGTDTAGTYKTLYTGGANGSKISGMWVTNEDGSAPHLVTCQLVRAAVFYGGVAFLVGTNLGYSTGLPAANIMSAALWPGLPVDGNGNPYFYLSANDTIQCTFATSLTSSTYLNVSAVVSDF